MPHKTPYLVRTEVIIHHDWNPEFDQDALCVCGHPYERHFDGYENMEPIGCKYCHCHMFGDTVEKWEERNRLKYWNEPEKENLYRVISLQDYKEKIEKNRQGNWNLKLGHGYPMKDGKVCYLVFLGAYDIKKLPFEPDAYYWVEED